MKKSRAKLKLGEKTVREIYEGPDAIERTMASQIEGIRAAARAAAVRHPTRVFFMGSGTSYHAGVIGSCALSRFTDILALPVQASEFPHSVANSIRPGDLMVAYSQSGESTDTIEALRAAKSKGAYVIGITNTPGSTLTLESNQSLVTQAGVEESVCATKTFEAQLAVTIALTALTAESTGHLSKESAGVILKSIGEVPSLIRAKLGGWNKSTNSIAMKLRKVHDVFILGSGIGYGVALEAGLKLKEASLTHSEAFSIAEFRHGPQSLVTKGVAVLVIAPELGKPFEFSERLVRELKEKKATLISIVEESRGYPKRTVDYELQVPSLGPVVDPMLQIVPVQLLAYNFAVSRKINPDSPRHLTKVVRVG